MTAQILNIRDYQNKRDIQRLYEEVTAELMAIAGPVEITNVALLDGSDAEKYIGEITALPLDAYSAPETDPA